MEHKTQAHPKLLQRFNSNATQTQSDPVCKHCKIRMAPYSSEYMHCLNQKICVADLNESFFFFVIIG